MKPSILIALMAAASSLSAATLNTSVTADTYIRNDGTLQGANGDGDTDNELLVGDNAGALRGLMAFDVSQIINDLNATGGGNFANLTINSATLEVFERRGFARTINVTVNSYAFDFVANTATWNAPATGDATAGGTIGSVLGSQSVAWDATVDNQSAVISLSTANLKSTIQNAATAGRINFLLNSTNTGGNTFLSITSDRSANTARHAKLTVDYTVIPAGEPVLELDPTTPNPDYAFPYSQDTASPLTRTLRYRNDGVSGTITVEDVVVTNSLGTAFAAGTTTPALPATLSPGQTIDIPVIATSSTAGTFTGSVFIDTDLSTQDKTVPLSASFYQSGQLFSANPSMTTGTASWNGGSTSVAPGLLGITGDAMARVRGSGDPLQPLVRSAHTQGTAIPNNLPDWCLDFRFTPIAPASFADYTGLSADGNFTDRTFQLVVQATDAVPAPALNDVLDDETLLNIAYFPDGITTGGIAGFYAYNQSTWQLIDFNGDGSALVLDGSTDLDTDADPLNGIGDGVLDSAAGDTVNAYRMTITGNQFGTPSASYNITLTGPGGLNKTATGLTAYHGRNITTHLPAAIAFITTDSSTASNASSGVSPSFWVDEIGYFAVARPARRLILSSGPTFLRSLNASTPTHTLTAFNDGTSAVDLTASLTGTSSVTITSPATFPVALPAGGSTAVVISHDPAGLIAPNTADAGTLTVASDDPLLASTAFPFLVTNVTDSNYLANGDFETVTANLPFPAGWTRTGTPSSVASFLTTGGGTAAVSLAPGQGILQDFAPAAADGLENFQADFAFQIGSETQAHRIRFEGNNGADLVTLRLTLNPAGPDTIEAFAAGPWTAALTDLTILPNTTYHLRVIGRNFGQTGREYTVGFSTDGVTFTTSAPLEAFHASPNGRLETATFECGATVGSSLLIDNVTVTTAPDDDFSAWMSTFTFAPGADLTATGDADNDGIANLVENVLGTDPSASSLGLVQVASAAGTLSFQHPLNAALASDVTYSYEWSTDLNEWNPSGQANTGGVNANISPAAPVAGVVTVTTSITAGSSATIFVRLVATQS